MKRKDVIKRIRQYAKDHDLVVVETEGGSHTKFTVGTAKTVVARHNEINEITAKQILNQITKQTEEDQ